MKKILILLIAVTLTGCGGNSLKTKIENAVGKEKAVLNLSEISDFEWTGVRILKPYQKKKILGEAFEQAEDSHCRWIFLGSESVITSFQIERSKLDCHGLPDGVFSPAQAIFIVEKGVMKERKKFQR